jgi:hypothetical protein
MGSWVDAAGDREGQRLLAGRMLGTLLMAAPLLEAAPDITGRLIERIAALDDTAFLGRLPALRDAFDVLSPAARQRFLSALEPTLTGALDLRLDHDSKHLARWLEADQAGRAAIRALDPTLLTTSESVEPQPGGA